MQGETTNLIREHISLKSTGLKNFYVEKMNFCIAWESKGYHSKSAFRSSASKQNQSDYYGKKKGKYPEEPMKTQSKNKQTAQRAGKCGRPSRD